MLKIIDVDYCGEFKLDLKFNDGVRRVVNLEPYLYGEVFGELRDHRKFIQYGLTPVTIEWANGADFAPEFLYSL